MYLRPVRLTDALACLAHYKPAILAGGTDFYSARGSRPVADDVLDISAIAELKGIREEADHWHFGALATWTEIIEAPLTRDLDCLKLAARGIGGPQIRNAGTIGGNVCNLSPSADGIPALLALDAGVELRSAAGTRTLALADFLSDNHTALARNELICAIRVPKRSRAVRSTFVKLAARRYLAISIATVAVALELSHDGVIVRAGIAVGGCSRSARRLSELERELIGRSVRGGLGALVVPRHLIAITPVSDVHATAEYRRDAAITLLRRALGQVTYE
ncbi:MAG: FAD binding domain-containing protein [Sulfurifustaceae bacterium]